MGLRSPRRLWRPIHRIFLPAGYPAPGPTQRTGQPPSNGLSKNRPGPLYQSVGDACRNPRRHLLAHRTNPRTRQTAPCPRMYGFAAGLCFAPAAASANPPGNFPRRVCLAVPPSPSPLPVAQYALPDGNGNAAVPPDRTVYRRLAIILRLCFRHSALLRPHLLPSSSSPPETLLPFVSS